MRDSVPVLMVKLPVPIVLFLILALGGCAGGQSTAGGGTTPAGIGSATLDLTPSGNSGVSGTATVTNVGRSVQVELNMRDLPDQPGAEHPAHIHAGGTCADDRAGNEAPIQYPLNSVITQEGGTGTSTTVIEGVNTGALFAGDSKYVNVHAQKTGATTPPGVSCADLPSRSG